MTQVLNTTSPDCNLDGQPIELKHWARLNTDQLARIVGEQQPAEAIECSKQYDWSLQLLRTEQLREATLDGEPEGGWTAVYARMLKSDQEAVLGGSPEYAGRDPWIRDHWSKNTEIYPLFIVQETEGYRLWDGHRRLAGAFHYALPEIWCLVGVPLK